MQQSATGPGIFARQYPFVFLLAALCAGIILQPVWVHVGAVHWLCFSVIIGLAAALLHRMRSAAPQWQWYRSTALFTAFTCLGAMLASLQDIRHNKSWYGTHWQQAHAICVQVTETPQIKEKTLLLPVTVRSMLINGKWMQYEGRLQLFVYKQEDMPLYREGQVLMLPAALVPIKSSGNPFAFDYAAYATRKGLYYQAFLPASDIRIIRWAPLRARPLSLIKQQLQQSITLNVKDSTTRALIEATLLNERASLDDRLWKAYAVTGIVHIIAISGMHIALFAGMLLLVLRLLPFQRLHKLKYIAAVAIVWCYVALTGFPPSAVRAALMFTLMAGGILSERSTNPVNIWAAAGFLLLCYNPYWLYDIGAQLSFLAVLSIVLFYKPIMNWYTPSYFIIRHLWSIIAVSIAVQVLVAPLVIYYFHQFPVMGLLANIPAALFSVLLLYGATIMFLLHLTGLSCLWLGKLLIWLTKGFHLIVQFLAEHTPGLMQRLFIDRYEYTLLMLATIGLCCFLFYKKQLYLYVAGLALLFLLADLMFKDYTAARQEQMIVYNASRTSLADVYKGKRVATVYPDEGQEEKIKAYILEPARLGFRATLTSDPNLSGLYRIHKATILFLDRCAALQPGQGFAVDFLVVSRHCTFDPEGWYRTFHPRKIIIDGSVPRWKAIRWKEQLELHGAKVHWVQEDGAWIYPATGSRGS